MQSNSSASSNLSLANNDTQAKTKTANHLLSHSPNTTFSNYIPSKSNETTPFQSGLEAYKNILCKYMSPSLKKDMENSSSPVTIHYNARSTNVISPFNHESLSKQDIKPFLHSIKKQSTDSTEKTFNLFLENNVKISGKLFSNFKGGNSATYESAKEAEAPKQELISVPESNVFKTCLTEDVETHPIKPTNHESPLKTKLINSSCNDLDSPNKLSDLKSSDDETKIESNVLSFPAANDFNSDEKGKMFVAYEDEE